MAAGDLVGRRRSIYAQRTPCSRFPGCRFTYVISAVLALYFNVFVLIVLLFEKVPALQALAPAQSEPPFQAAQLVALVIFAALAIRAARKFRGEASHA